VKIVGEKEGGALKVIIVGTGMTSVEGAPTGPDWETWGVGRAWQILEHADMWFELHNFDLMLAHPERYEAHAAWLQEQTMPIVCKHLWPQFKNPVLFPLEECIENFGKYFTNSVSYMIAYAIMKGAEEIALMGINMAWNTEFSEQRPSIEYIIGRAMGLGIAVHIPDSSDVLKCGHMYAFEPLPSLARRMKSMRVSLKRDIERKEVEVLGATAAKNELVGELKAMEYTIRHL
jgi:hypothetical protein